MRFLELSNFACLPGKAGGSPFFTSKWNKIEHRLFSFITRNWRGKPLLTHQVIVNLICATTTKAGLLVKSRIDERIYPKGRRTYLGPSTRSGQSASE